MTHETKKLVIEVVCSTIILLSIFASFAIAWLAYA